MITRSPYYNIAHRGARSLAPENTMAAFIKAWQVGAHGIETDVSVSSDGVLILFHDKTFKRTTDIKKVYPERQDDALHTFSWAEIEKLDAGSWFVETDPFDTITQGEVAVDELNGFIAARVPTLEELLIFVKEKAMFVNIEIKPLPRLNSSFPIVENVLALLDKHQLDTHLFSISSYYHPFLTQIQSLNPAVEVNALIGEEENGVQEWGNYEFRIYNANVDRIDVIQLEEAQKRKCRINLYTVNQLTDMQHYLTLGVDKIITDYPQLLSGYQQS